MDRHLTYVALTRHRDDAVLYASKQAFASVQELARTLSRDGSSSTTLDHDFMRQRVIVADPFPSSNDPEARTEAQISWPSVASQTAQTAAPAQARATAPEETRAAGPAPHPVPDQPHRDAQPRVAAGSGRGPRPRIMVHAIPVPSDRSASAAQREVRVN